MKKLSIFTLTLLVSSLLCAQTDVWSDPKSKAIIEEDCHGRIFEKTEEPSHVKVSTTELADSLQQYCQQQYFPSPMSLARLCAKAWTLSNSFPQPH